MEENEGDVSAWLDGVRAGLGKLADVFVEYGASTVADLRELDEDDIDQLAEQLRSLPGGPAPLQVKQIT